jgi:hypothetical protein
MPITEVCSPNSSKPRSDAARPKLDATRPVSPGARSNPDNPDYAQGRGVKRRGVEARNLADPDPFPPPGRK